MRLFTRPVWGRALLLAAVVVGVQAVSAQTWNCGQYGDNVTATRSGETLTFSGKGAMIDFVEKKYDASVIGNTVTVIDMQARPWNESRGTITKVVIKDGVTNIGYGAFNEFVELTSVSIPGSVVSIGKYAFGGCINTVSIDVEPGNASYSSENGVLFDKDKTNLIYYPRKKEGAYIIPNGVTSIGNDKFGVGAFAGCFGLTSVTIPNGVTSIGEEAFNSCVNLKSVSIPGSVTAIEQGAFLGCISLTSITISNGVTNIGPQAFQGCIGLTSVAIPNSVELINDLAFAGCTGLTSITIPNSVKNIGLGWQGGGTFNACTGLTSITIGTGIESINRGTFAYCKNLKSITILAVKPPSYSSIDGAGILSGVDNPSVCLYVPSGSLNSYKSAGPWKRFFTCIEAKKLSQAEAQAEAQKEAKEAQRLAAMSSYFTDPRDGQKYRTVKIGGKTWMAQNLRYQGKPWTSTVSPVCYGDNNSNCEKYGRLYTWITADGVCPKGWRLPNPTMWEDMMRTVGVTESGKLLKTVTGWENNGNGVDAVGFSAQPGGGRTPDGKFEGIGATGFWWTSNGDGKDNGFVYGVKSGEGQMKRDELKIDHAFSVRCVQK